MPKVNFYLLKQTDEQARSMLACRLADKLYKQNRRVHVHLSSSETAREFDQLLWSFTADSFLPHRLCTDPEQASAPVVIGWDQHPATCADLLNLGDTLPPGHARLDTIAEFVVNDEQAKTQSRQLWNTYKQLGYELQLHQL
ncbi:MAG: DNA polymerase III subunit chi [Pseudomonadota bacterium]